MDFAFEKFQGTGNDFIIADNRLGNYTPLQNDQIIKLCRHKFGIGSDGLILLNSHSEFDFEMVFYNPDATMSFCGNGARCAVAFALKNEFLLPHSKFVAIDGVHEYRIENGSPRIKMNDVDTIQNLEERAAFIDTGSPHYVLFAEDLSTENVVEVGRKIRFSEPYALNGVNVNLIQPINNTSIRIATYERGVEHETLSCGTGATACALFFAHRQGMESGELQVFTKGGTLQVAFQKVGSTYTSIWLGGPAMHVFSGQIEIA